MCKIYRLATYNRSCHQGATFFSKLFFPQGNELLGNVAFSFRICIRIVLLLRIVSCFWKIDIDASFCNKRYFILFEIAQNFKAFDFWYFLPILVQLKLTCLVTLFWPQAAGFQNLAKRSIFGIFYKLLSTQYVNVARFARNVEWDFFCDFQTPWGFFRYCITSIQNVLHRFCFFVWFCYQYYCQ